MTVVTRPRRRSPRDRRPPHPALGPHVYLLHRLDAHLVLMHSLRRELGGVRRSARPGARLQAAAASALAAQRYAADVANALAAILDGEPQRRG
jgi:hypothetical protein